MKTITYLLGAGASAECLPVVKGMADDIKTLTERYSTQYRQHFNFSLQGQIVKSSNTNETIFKSILSDLEWLQKICRSHSSVDTYAKKLYLDGNDKEYVKLKNILSIYFTLAQKFPVEWRSGIHFDKRYDNLWASIMNKDEPLPANMRIISWNYDSQLEFSYSTFFKDNLENSYRKLNMLSFHDDVRNFDPNKFAIFKLNGSAKITSHIGYKSSYLAPNFIDDDHANFFNELFKSYNIILPDSLKTAAESYKSQLSFAWEHNELTNDFYAKLKESLKDTTILVVIGYSFPFFNRKIDKRIINEYMPNLNKVYFQAIEPESLKERFLAITDRLPNDRLLLKYDREQFTFPNELDI